MTICPFPLVFIENVAGHAGVHALPLCVGTLSAAAVASACSGDHPGQVCRCQQVRHTSQRRKTSLTVQQKTIFCLLAAALLWGEVENIDGKLHAAVKYVSSSIAVTNCSVAPYIHNIYTKIYIYQIYTNHVV